MSNHSSLTHNGYTYRSASRPTFNGNGRWQEPARGPFSRTMKIVVIVAALVATITTAAARADVLRLTLRDNGSRVPMAQLVRAEAAVTDQVNTQLRRYWHVRPIVFVPSGGYPVDIFGGNQLGFLGAQGAHMVMGKIPTIWLATGTARNHFMLKGSGGGAMSWTVGFSHEVMELSVNPYLKRKSPHRIKDRRVWTEVADAVEDTSYVVDGVRVSDFVTPRWFGYSGMSRRYDFLGRVHTSYKLAPGGYIPGSALDEGHNNL